MTMVMAGPMQGNRSGGTMNRREVSPFVQAHGRPPEPRISDALQPAVQLPDAPLLDQSSQATRLPQSARPAMS